MIRRLWWVLTGRWTWRKPKDDGFDTSGKAIQVLQSPLAYHYCAACKGTGFVKREQTVSPWRFE